MMTRLLVPLTVGGALMATTAGSAAVSELAPLAVVVMALLSPVAPTVGGSGSGSRSDGVERKMLFHSSGDAFIPTNPPSGSSVRPPVPTERGHRIGLCLLLLGTVPPPYGGVRGSGGGGGTYR